MKIKDCGGGGGGCSYIHSQLYLGKYGIELKSPLTTFSLEHRIIQESFEVTDLVK